MREKKLIKRVSEDRPHRYSAIAKQKTTEKNLLTQWMNKIGMGSAASLAMKALGSHPISNEELSELRDLLDSIEQKNNNKK